MATLNVLCNLPISACSVTESTLDFLTRLREKDPAAADQRYAAMLANTGGDM